MFRPGRAAPECPLVKSRVRPPPGPDLGGRARRRARGPGNAESGVAKEWAPANDRATPRSLSGRAHPPQKAWRPWPWDCDAGSSHL